MKMKKYSKKMFLFAVTAALSIGCAMTAMAKERLDVPENLYWSNTSKTKDDDDKEGSYAKWEESENAYRYKVDLYREDPDGGSHHVVEKTTDKHYFNFRSFMDKVGDYTFRVKAIAKNKSDDYSDSYWSDYSDTYWVDEERTENASIPEEKTASVVSPRGWIQDSIGWWYAKSDNSYPKNEWFQDPASKLWYYFDESGYMKTGWVEMNYGAGPVYYYCDPKGTPEGAMAADRDCEIDGVIYHFGKDGALIR